MKKFLVPIALFSLGVIVSSCGTYKESTNKILPVIVNEVTTTPKMIDYKIDFSKKITGTASGKVAGKLSLNKYLTPEYYTERAIADAVKNGGADFLVEPSMDQDVKGKKITVSVSGYGATFDGVTDIDLKDSVMMSSYMMLTSKSVNALSRTQGSDSKQYARGNMFKRMKNNLNRETVRSNQMGL